MRKTLLFLAFSVAAGAAQAQIKCWNEGGKRVCGDAPPAGAKITTLKAPASGSEAAPAEAAKDGASKAPLTAAQKEQEAKKRQADEKKATEKAASAEKTAAAKAENCERARNALRTYESGQRISQLDSKGERFFLEDAQIEVEKDKARQAVKDSCG